MTQMYEQRSVQLCEDCGEVCKYRRLRCQNCKKLVCIWCAGHVHNCSRVEQEKQT